MAQTPQPGETGGSAETPPPGAGQSGGIFGNPTTLLLLAFVVIFFFWNRRRRSVMEERLQVQRREREETAQRSAMDVAHIMRQPVSRDAAAAAASEGLASAAASGDSMPSGAADEDRARVMERAEANAEAERAAEEQAMRAAEAADLAGESAERRVTAAEAAAEEAQADTADAMRELDNELPVPLGAIAGNGTAMCPPEYPVKGNASSRIYHEPGQVSYPPTIAEFCFASGAAAEAAGFRQSRARVVRAQE